MKFTTNHSKYIKEWKAGNVRILNEVYAKVFYRYTVEKFDGTRWIKVRSFRTLAEAKEAAAWILEDEAMDASRMI